MAGGRCRILVIEDDHESAEQIVESLVATGYEVDLAADGDGGLGRARSGEYAVMTIDRMLPGIDGGGYPATQGRENLHARLDRQCARRD
jgi:two-component system OmpR family response regulator